MVMIPKTVGELRRYLETYPDDMLVRFLDDDEGTLWTFSLDQEAVDYIDDNQPFEILTLHLFDSKDPY